MEPINVETWVEHNQKHFLPPICNKLLYKEGQIKLFFVSGPNIRDDYHINEGEEFFYQVKGDMYLKVVEHGRFRDLPIKEGQVFLLPPKIPHSPQRYANTLGMVTERERKADETDCLRYYVKGSTEILFEKWFHCEDLGPQLAEVIKEFMASEQKKTGRPIQGTITNNPPYFIDANKSIPKPFYFKNWIRNNLTEINLFGFKRLFNDSYASQITVYGKGTFQGLTKIAETVFWQQEGSSCLMLKVNHINLNKDDIFNVPIDTAWNLNVTASGLVLSIVMHPGNKNFI